MIQYSVIIPQRDRVDEVRRQLPMLADALAQLHQPHEIIIVDDGSSSAALRTLERLQSNWQTFRVLRLDKPGGASVALSAGIAAARGEVIAAIEPGDGYPPAQIPSMVACLNRADLVVGRRRRGGLAKLWHRIARIPRWLILGLDAHDPDCLLWVARREAVTGLNLARGMGRYLPWLVARRGFRVCEAYVEHHGGAHRLQDLRPNPLDLLAAWWLCRRWGDNQAHEVAPLAGKQPELGLIGADDHEGCGVGGVRSHDMPPAASDSQRTKIA